MRYFPDNLGLATDLSLHREIGTVELRDGYIVVRTPDACDYFFGNMLVLPQRPSVGDRERLNHDFARLIGMPPSIAHRAFSWPEQPGQDVDFEGLAEADDDATINHQSLRGKVNESTLPIRTRRCTLRTATLADYAALVAAVTSPAFPAALPLARLHRQNKLQAWLTANVSLSMAQNACLLSIDALTGEQCIGQVALSPKDESSWNLAFWLHPAQWGKGLAAEAAQAAVHYGFTVLGIEEIAAGAVAWNDRSMKTLRQVGLRPIRRDDASESASSDQDAIQAFSISRQAWLETASTGK